MGTILIVVLFGSRLLPSRTAKGLPTDFSRHARTLVDHYQLGDEALTLISRTSGLAEVVIPPRSEFVGDTVFPGMVTDSGDLVILAVQRKGEELGPGEVVLAVGDVLLLQGSWTALDENLADPNVLVVDTPEQVRRQVVPLGTGAREAIVILAAMVVLLATGIVPSVVAGLLAAGAMVLLRVVSVDGAYRAINWTTVVLVAGMIPLSTAMTTTGAADLIADTLVGMVRDIGPVCPAGRPLRHHRRARPAHQQHGHRAHRDPHRGRCGGGSRRLAAAGADVGDRRGGGRLPDAGRDPGEHDGHGPGRLPLRGLLEARAAAAGPVLPRRRLPGPGLLGVLSGGRVRRPPDCQPARKLRRTVRVALSGFGSSRQIDCHVPSASRPPTTGTVSDGDASSGRT